MLTSVQRVRDICRQKGIPISKIEQICGFGNGYLNPKKQTKLPYDRALLISDFLGVSVEYILTGEEKKPADQTVNGLTKERQALIDLVMSCPEDRATDLLTAMQLFLQSWQR